jgi:hypothetical protein
VPEEKSRIIVRCGFWDWCPFPSTVATRSPLPLLVPILTPTLAALEPALSALAPRASTIYLYTSTPPLTCDGRRESQHVNTDRRRENQHVDTNGRRENQHVDIKGCNSNFYNKMRKPGLELETLDSDTMLSFMH